MPEAPQATPTEPTEDVVAAPPRRAWAALLVGSGVILAGLLLIVVANIGNPADETAQQDDPFGDEVPELITPPAVPENILDTVNATSGFDQNVQPLLERGAWIQVADENGELAQQYRCQSLTPNPNGMPAGWFEMEKPEAEIFLSDGRVMRLTGDSGLAFSPHRRLEEGTLHGNVRIRVIEFDDDGSNESTVLDVTTSEASFDSVSGQMQCPNDVLVRGQRIDLDGRAMRLLFDDRQDVMRLYLEEVDRIIVLAERENTPSDEVAAIRPAPQHPSGTTPPPTTTPADAVVAGPPTTPGTNDPAPAPQPAPAPTTFYELLLRDDVIVEEVDTGIRRVANADELRMVFTFESEGLSNTVAQTTPTEPLHAGTSMGGSWHSRLAQRAIAAQGDTRRRLIIRCSGPLSVEPVSDPGSVLRSPRDTRLTLTGAPVRVEDIADETIIQCAEIRYDTSSSPARETVRLIGSDAVPFSLRNPDTLATGEGFLLDITNGTGRLDGAGTMTWRDTNNPDAEPLHINWEDGIDLAFHERAENDGMAMGPLKSATFLGDVHVDHTEFTLDAESVTAELDERDDGSAEFKTLLARGDARALGLLDGEALRADDLRLEFANATDGNAIPQRLLATGNVEALQERQVLWADLLEIEFDPPAGGQDDTSVDVRSLLAHGAVQILLDDGTRVFADDLQADAMQRNAVLTGEAMQLVQDRSMIDQSPRFTLDEDTGLFTLEGRGRLRVFDRSIIDPTAGGKVELVQVERRDDLIEDLRILWQDNARFQSNTEQTAGVATFHGDVTVRGRDINLDHAQTLTARFVEIEKETVLDQIDAEAMPGSALAIVIRQLDESGDSPTTTEQRLWASTLNVVLEPDTDAETNGAESVLVRSFTAEHDVRIGLDDGTTVFADRVIGFPRTSTADLHGMPVSIVAGTTLLRCEPSVRLVDHGDSIDLLGAGRLTTFENEIVIPPVGRFDPDAQSGPTQLLATWTDSAMYVPADASGLSVIDLRGGVHVDARPDPLEMVRIDSEGLTLEFEEVAGEVTGTTDEGDDLIGGSQRLTRLIAIGGAKIENVAWQRPEDVGQQDLSRVFYVSGDHVQFDNISGTARVAGAGELLIHDTWDDSVADAAAAPTEFASSGTTLFKWTDGLDMTPIAGDLSEIIIRGGVQMLHRDMQNDTATVTADRFEATVKRTRGTDGSPSFDTGGHADLDRVRGIGNVFVRTTTRDISCGTFDYQMDRVAELIAAPGGVVVVRTRGETGSMVANHLRWDLVEDRITVVGAGGGG